MSFARGWLQPFVVRARSVFVDRPKSLNVSMGTRLRVTATP
jgi:hypothetical protein